MTETESTPAIGVREPATEADRRRFDFDPLAVAAALIPFALIVYLGLENGGYDNLVYSEVGIVAWWSVVLILAVLTVGGLLSSAPSLGLPAWLAIGMLVTFAAWTGLALLWTDSAERTMAEFARVLVYVGVFVLALLAAGGGRMRPMLGGVGAGCAVIAAIAVLARLQPEIFPDNELVEVLPSVQSRLAYPFGYWNALAGLTAIGLPLMVWLAIAARPLLLRALAAAFVPVMILCSYYTLSRAGTIGAVVAIVVLVALASRRLALLPTLAILAGGGAALLWAAHRRPSLQDGLTTETALAQGDAMLAITIAVGIVAAMSVTALALLARRGRLPIAPRVPARTTAIVMAVGAVLAIGAFVALDGPGRVSDGFEEFKQPTDPGSATDRYVSASGNGRWQYWSAAVDAFESDPLHGIGPGTFVFWWSANRDIPGFIRDAHSLFVEVLGELGVVGLALLAAFIALILITGTRRAFAASGAERLAVAAGTAAVLAFAVTAGLDWLWEHAVIPVAFLIAASAVLRAPSGRAGAEPARERRLGRAAAAVAAAAGVLAIAAIAVAMLSQQEVAESQAEVRAGDLERALASAEHAGDLQPYAAAPLIQRALVLELDGELVEAETAAREATGNEPTNWETWYVLSRIQAQLGKDKAALRAFREARSLDPLSPLFGGAGAENEVD